MAQVFSWKISTGKYSYLIQENGSYIRDKITNQDKLHEMANTVNGWSEVQYASAYNAMKDEVNTVFGAGTLSEPYTKYYSFEQLGGSVVLLSGKDGIGGGGGGGGVQPALTDDDYRELERKINEELNKYRDSLNSQVQAIRDSIADQVSATISEALSHLNFTKDELDAIRAELEATKQSAQNALDAARALFENFDGSNITPDMLANILAMSERFGNWLDNSGSTLSLLLADYDEILGYIGGLGLNLDSAMGLIDLIAMNINTISGTVGTINMRLDASLGQFEQYAEWFSESADILTRITRLMDASAAAIEDLIEFAHGDITSVITRRMDARRGEIVDELKSYNPNASAITSIISRLNLLSASVTTNIYNLSGDVLTTVWDELDAMRGEIRRGITIAESGLSVASDLRETWSKESGMLRTVANMVIREDELGPIYYYIGVDGSKKVRVWPMENGHYNDRYDLTGNISEEVSGETVYYKDHILPDFLTTIMSYIQQQAGSIEFAVTSGDILTALRLEVGPDGSVIYMTADRVMIDADVIARSLTANAANIGGVHLGQGMISAKTGNNKWALTSAGTLEATGAIIDGDIVARSLRLIGSAQNDLNDYIDEKLDDFIASGGVTEAKVNQLIVQYLSENDYLDEEGLRSWMQSHYSGLTLEEIQEYIDEIMASHTSTVTKQPNSAGGWTHIATIDGVEYQWDTFDGGDYLLLNSVVSGSGGTRFIVSKDGLLEANNAIIYGTVYATAGYFQGSLSATNGYIANLRFGSATGKLLSDYIDDKIGDSIESGLDPTVINQLINDYLEESGFTGFVTEEFFEQWVANWNETHPSGLTEATVSAIAKTVVNSEISIASSTTNQYGGITHTVNIGGREYSWDTYNTGDYLVLGNWFGDSSSANTGFCVSTKGLLQANNAVIYGKVYASEGYFKGSISADSGYFTGDITANSITLGTSAQNTIDGAINSKLANIPSGVSAEEVNRMLAAAAAASGWSVTDIGDYYLIGSSIVSGTSAFTVSKNGLLVASNAIISGSVYATNGVFNGTVYANDGEFKGKLVASSGTIGGMTIRKDGIVGDGFSLTPSGLTANDATIKGSIRQPFARATFKEDVIYWDEPEPEVENTLEKYDNIYLDYGTEGGLSSGSVELKWNNEQIGRRIFVVHNKSGASISDYGFVKIEAPSGYYFFEDGVAKSELLFSNEVIELLGYGISDVTPNVFYGYIVICRKNMMTKKRYGHELRALCMGTVNKFGEISNVTTFDGTSKISYANAKTGTTTTAPLTHWNSSAFSRIASHSGSSGTCYVRIPNKWFKDEGSIDEAMMVQITPRTAGANIAITNYSTSGFTTQSIGNVFTSWQEYSEDSGYHTVSGFRTQYMIPSFDFILYNRKDWSALGSDANLESLFVRFDNQALSFIMIIESGESGFEPASDLIQESTLICNKAGATIQTALTINSSYQEDFSTMFTTSWNSQSKKLTVEMSDFECVERHIEGVFKVTATYGGETATTSVLITYNFTDYNDDQ